MKLTVRWVHVHGLSKKKNENFSDRRSLQWWEVDPQVRKSDSRMLYFVTKIFICVWLTIYSQESNLEPHTEGCERSHGLLTSFWIIGSLSVSICYYPNFSIMGFLKGHIIQIMGLWRVLWISATTESNTDVSSRMNWKCKMKRNSLKFISILHIALQKKNKTEQTNRNTPSRQCQLLTWSTKKLLQVEE